MLKFLFDNFEDDPTFINIDEELSYTDSDAEMETKSELQYCMSCSNFKKIIGEGGICKLNESCLCKDPKALIDIWDFKCEEWTISDDYTKELEKFKSNK